MVILFIKERVFFFNLDICQFISIPKQLNEKNNRNQEEPQNKHRE